ncbi:Glycosyl transferase, group 2 protein [Pseudomonas syringae pv. coriandricola]|uniref:Glycosyl transferase, group 2 protein n=2 Tax=Pseudomonas syringae group genomosp. 3 TaxID=251701 RepID=A0A3M4TX56_9PSED|nr:Glycosyl transferase, group 2 family protein [Pseudomonas syringae pv. antirrhini]RMM20804.1 Glycosyl transferase, group 2 protein [Pseudomonas syringae pv. berberidis]RMR31815.1 Glycosyl transferase, group 2 protein [Pseudomonas syringae pv. coriandricola]RMP41719.1 Glycosyl transferase, group 2 protein [Pseudomonas syringae pv. antirrhini]RMP44078.1 Glycosyl transferase, group 2 protein [Pseudomonas syringae pv. antirrhini]
MMCTYNGAAYLREQLESFAAQTFSDWVLYVSDDASTDDTLRILSDYQVLWGNQRLVIFNGPCKGFAENFISLVQRPEIEADYFAFSDQDDVWFSDKLQRSVNRLEHLDSSKPALYCSRTRLVDADLKVIGVSPLFSKPPSFKNALVQSLAGANTMLINQTARGLLVRLPEHSPLIAHDWLTYLLVTGCGGEVCYDAQPCLDYRQHSGNLIGANASTRDRLVRFRKMLSGRFIEWNDANVAILKGMERVLTVENRAVLTDFDNGRRQTGFKRLSTLRKAGIYRQTLQGNLSLMLAVCLGRV